MCDCQDENNINSIPVGPIGPTGPTGPQGPAGPSPVLGGTSGTTVTVGLGLETFILDANADFATGQRLGVSSVDGTKTMSGLVNSYSTLTDELVLNVDYVVGSGSNNDWILYVSGERGATGATGAAGAAGSAGAAGTNSYTTMTSGASGGGLTYDIVVGNTSWMSIGQIVYIQGAGYYSVTSITDATHARITNPEYTGNTPATLVGGPFTYKVSPGGIQGIAGTNGTDGFNYETVDGNNIPAEATSSYQFLMRNADDTGYTFLSLSDLKTLLSLIP